jgi:hypothetical protein
MDEQAQDSAYLSQTDHEIQRPPDPTEQPVSTMSAVLLAAAGAIPVLAILVFVLSMRPGSTPVPEPSTQVVVLPEGADPYAAVRARAQEAFDRGKAFHEQGDLDRALIELDTASVNDPDKRADIQELLNRTVEAIRVRDTGPAATAAAMPSPSPSTPLPTIVARGGFGTYSDVTKGVVLLVPDGWKRTEDPEPAFGTEGLVEFADQSGEARFVLSSDSAAGTSPELYAATLETRMKEVPGYVGEQAQLVTVGTLPGARRLFSIPGKSPAGRQETVRVLQTIVGSGARVFILTAESSADKFDSFRETFETMSGTFRTR